MSNEEAPAGESIYGTEKDKVNCAFFLKIGACRHGDMCSRVHHKPLISKTILLKNLYHNPASHMSLVEGQSLEFDENETQGHLDEFYEDIYDEMSKFGEIEEMHVCHNLGSHLMGNVYIKFYEEDSATKALTNLRGRYYAGRPIYAEYCAVVNFKEARCRQYDNGDCDRGSFCNFMHIKKIGKEVFNKINANKRRVDERDKPHRKDNNSSRDTSSRRSRSPDRQYKKSRRSRSRERERRDYRDRDSRDSRDSRSSRDYRDSRDSRDGRDSRSSRDSHRDRESSTRDKERESSHRDSRDHRDARDRDRRRESRSDRGSFKETPREEKKEVVVPPKVQEEEDYSPSHVTN